MAAIAFLSDVDRLHFAVETQRLINAVALDADGVMSIVVERARTATNADGGVVELMEGDDMVSQAVIGVAESALGTRLPIEDSFSGLCIRQGIPLACRDSETDQRVDRDACRESGLRSVIAAPLIHCGQKVGVLKVTSAQPDHFDSADMDVLELMANLIASSLSNSETFELDAYSALHDELTGLPNRVLLMDRLTQVVYEARRHGRPFGLFFIDLDGFKAVNETLGRDMGDAVLRAVSRGLSATVRTGDTLARLGGDQFVIICGNADRSVEERIRSRLDSVFAKARDELQLDGLDLTASIGVIWSAGDEASAESLLTSASASMYRAKRPRTTPA